MDAPNYVQGLYSVAERDAIFTKAKKYPDAADGLQNQVPTIFPDGTVGWRQIPEGGDGTANANIAVVEDTQYASKTYYAGDLLIYNSQLYMAVGRINAGIILLPGTNITPTRVDLQTLSVIGKGENCFRNWYLIGGGSQQGGGQFPINQQGLTSYTNVGQTIDGWYQTGGTTAVESGNVRHTSPAGSSSDFYQIIDRPLKMNTGTINFGIWTLTKLYAGSIPSGSLTEETVIYTGDDCQLLLAPESGNRIKATIRVYAGYNVPIKAAKLEAGPTCTLAYRVSQDQTTYTLADTPPDYGEELAKCQRYLLVVKSGGWANYIASYAKSADTADVGHLLIPTPVTMKSPVSVSGSGLIRVLNGTAGFQIDIANLAPSITGFSPYVAANMVTVRVPLTLAQSGSDTTINTGVVDGGSYDNSIVISAE